VSVTVCIPTIPGRERDLGRAIKSINIQDWRDVETAVFPDHDYRGPAYARNYMVDRARTEWIAFLDDDDYFLPHHISTLVLAAEESGADLVWPWFRVDGGTDPFPQNRGRQWDREDPHLFPITVLVRRSVIREVGGFDYGVPMEDPNEPGGGRMVNGEDWRLWLRMSEAGARFHHVDEVTWVWRHHGRNSSGLPEMARSLYANARQR
jgi:glycosyltransferase involved in cell wall biosynthesis